MAKVTSISQEEKMEQLRQSVNAINKKNPGSVQSANSIKEIRQIQLGIPAFDYVTDGGIVIGQVLELYGELSSLKSYFLYKAIGKFQRYDWANDEPDAFTHIEYKKRKSNTDIPEVVSYKLRRGYKPKNPPEIKHAVLIDVEGTYDKNWGSILGVFNDGLLYSNPHSVNKSIDVLEAFLMAPLIGFVMYDSMVAIGADAEVEASMENEQMGINARLWNKAARKIRAAINANPDKEATLGIVNGFYEKIGISFGNPEVVKNGKQMGLLKATAIRTTPLKEIKGKVSDVDVTIGRNVKLTNKKNKFGAPYRELSLYFSFTDDGELEVGDTDVLQQLIEIACRYELIERVGHGYKYNGVSGRGMESFKANMYKENMVKTLKEDVYANMITR